MKNILDELKQLSPLTNLAQLIEKSTLDNFPIFVSNFYGSSRNLFTKLITEKERQVYLLCEDLKSLDECNAELSILNLSDQTILLSELKPDTLQEKLTEISNRDNFVLLSTYELLSHKLPNRELIRKNTTRIAVGGDLSFSYVVEYLNLLNYQRENFVEAPGDFSLRGAIIDYWSYSEKVPVRLEFDGDFLESIRSFDPESQRSIESLQYTTLAGELNISSSENESNIFDYLKNPLVLASQYELNNLTAPRTKNYTVSVESEFLDPDEGFSGAEIDSSYTISPVGYF